MPFIDKLKQDVILKQYRKHETDVTKYARLQSKYRFIKNIFEISLILLGFLGTFIPVIFYIFFENNEKILTITFSSLSFLETVISVLISKVFNGYCLEKYRIKKELSKEYKDKLFVFFTNAAADNEIDDGEFKEYQDIIKDYDTKLEERIRKITLGSITKNFMFAERVEPQEQAVK